MTSPDTRVRGPLTSSRVDTEPVHPMDHLSNRYLCFVRLMRMKVVGTVIPDDLIVEIRDLEKKLSCPFNRKLARLLVLTFNDGFVVLLTAPKSCLQTLTGTGFASRTGVNLEKGNHTSTRYSTCTTTNTSTFQSWTRGSNNMRM